MTREISITGEFEAAPLTALAPGHWYIGLICARCGQRFAIMNEPSNSGGFEISGDARFDANCPSCGHRARYGAENLVSFQSAQGGSVSTAG
jgi:DNA-directed RNA polymerase subunit RPC12/RpoP